MGLETSQDCLAEGVLSQSNIWGVTVATGHDECAIEVEVDLHVVPLQQLHHVLDELSLAMISHNFADRCIGHQCWENPPFKHEVHQLQGFRSLAFSGVVIHYQVAGQHARLFIMRIEEHLGKANFLPLEMFSNGTGQRV
eukprot:CAMPEP_0170632388 /NCGR_PEP_ID=MMETSP0224-20130122/35292_1 /TAXON_ID=285029 /ORGANISM="Togula jolla, Strain CCCM 725" /LENGTH=138 /DNA_ID=CAMNT_0010961079 /DNA_START=932 /DNA_END=1345 /DNA_ORIENTATION=+